MKKKILVIFILYLIMSIFLYPLRESIWYHLFYTIAYMIAVVIYFALTKKNGLFSTVDYLKQAFSFLLIKGWR